MRLLVPNSQIGCILGKGGSIVSDIRSKSGARVKIFGPSERPAIAGSDDELVQITGDPQCVKAALEDILARLRDNPPRNFPQVLPLKLSSSLSVNLYMDRLMSRQLCMQPTGTQLVVLLVVG